ncbi:winged helix-turn-helix domain-containing protein [Craurococcus roseus]|uniref:Winged helix-turn-helix domain-containing protein n=1 Tax=Craurococcus roseus TaxID=77585 RepID=A0ABN1G4Z6_9PROT
MTELRTSAVEPALSFDRFQILPRQRLLLETGRPVRIGSRAFDILLALLERPGERVGKAELLARVWPDTHVVEGNLKFQVAALRRVLRDGQDGRRFIETSQGQGYRFVAPVAVIEEGERPVPPPVGAARRHNLPEQLTPLVGRGEVVAKLAGQLSAHRLLTIVGPGGIGKTSVALAVAERVVDAYEDGVWVVDLAWTADPDQVRGAVAAAVGLEVSPGLTTRDLVAALRGRKMLLVLDNCMHVVDAAAELVSAILRGAPHVRVVATSREPLRTEGERLCRLEPLQAPPPSPRIEAAEALRYASVQLFVEQAAAGLDAFELTDGDAPLVAEICRKLDGIPLAIGLAAARVGLLGLRGLAAQLDDRLRPLTGGRRTALPRHRTMRAALDWSHDLLGPPEQTVFRRLAVFVDGFTLAAAAGVAADEGHSGDEVVRLVLELAEKSLVVADLDSPGPRFRLLDTTRAYALEKAREGGELASLARRHAAYFLELVEAAAREREEGDDGYAAVEPDMDNLRAALAWAFAPAGDPAIGVGLAAAALPLWFSTSLLGEALAWTEKAIQTLDEAGLRGSRQEMALQTALGISLQMARGRTSEAHAALNRALALAERHRDADFRLHVLHTLWVYHMRVGGVRTALDHAHKAEAIAASMADPVAPGTAEWMLGIAMHFAGEHQAARSRLEHLLLAPPPRPRRRQIRRAGFDPRVTTRYVLGHVLWVQGHPDQAAEAVRIAVEEARRLQHPVTLCSVLAWGACALALLARDLDEAWRSATELVHHAEKHALADHLSYGLAALEIISLQKAGPEADVEQVRAALERWRASQWHVFLSVGDFAEAAAAAGLAGEISTVVDEALQRAERDQELWAYPEMLRVRGELLLRQDVPDPRGARRYFVRSLERARAQGALAWRLRSAASLHRLDLRQGDARESREALSRAYGRFGEGSDTPDLRAAKQLLVGRREPGPAERGGAARAL